MFNHRYKVNVKSEDGNVLKFGVIAGSFGEAEELIMKFRDEHDLSFSIVRMLKVEQVLRIDLQRVLTDEEVLAYQKDHMLKVKMRKADINEV